MKKLLLALGLLVLVLCLVLTACGRRKQAQESGSTKDVETPGTNVEEPVEDPTETPVEQPGETPPAEEPTEEPAHEHTWDSGVDTTPATLLAEGVKTYTCIECGEQKTEPIPKIGEMPTDGPSGGGGGGGGGGSAPAHTHTWNSGVITKEATCTENGVKTYTCTACSDKKAEVIPATGHTYGTWITETAATCTETGSKGHYHCAACGKDFDGDKKELADVNTPVLGHDYKESATTPATCTEPQKKTYKCTRCNDEQVSSIGVANGHSIGGVTPSEKLVSGCEYILEYECKTCHAAVPGEKIYKHSYVASITTAPTCKADGEKKLTCSVCEDTQKEKIAMNATGHNWQEGTVSDGKREDECSICHEKKTVFVYTSANATGEIETNDLAGKEIALKDASITLDENVTENDDIKGKNITLSVGVTSTDEDKEKLGLTPKQLEQIGDNPVYDFTLNNGTSDVAQLGGYVTITLPYELGEGEDVDSIAIWYIDEFGQLTSIGATYNNGFVTFKTNHFSYYTVTRLTPKERCAVYGHSWAEEHVDPTCTTEGYDRAVCIRCHESEKTNIVPATGHDYQVSVKAATCTAAGVTTHTCANCQASYNDETPALGHNWVLANTKDATCTEAGVLTYHCDRCDGSYALTSPALGHQWKLVETKDATCTEEGFEKYHCDQCNGDDVKVLPKVEHEFDDGEIVPPTATEQGYTLYTCKNCTYSYKDHFVPALGTQCNHIDLQKVTLDLSQYKTCGGTISYYACSCGAVKLYDTSKFDCYLDEAEETSYTDQNGLEHAVYTYVCAECGLKILEDDCEGNTSCDEKWVISLFQGNTAILENLVYEVGHDYESTFAFGEGKTCTDGYYETETCTECGQTYRFFRKEHDYSWRSVVDLSDYGLCGGSIYDYCCQLCDLHMGDYYFEDGACNWERIGTTADGFEEYYCENCHTTKLLKEVEAETDKLCTYNFTTNLKYLRDGAELYSLDWSITYVDHDYEVTYQLKGESCKDGVKEVGICKRCGDQYTESYRSHRTHEVETVDLTAYGACQGTLRFYRCICGQEESVEGWDTCANTWTWRNYTDADGHKVSEEIKTCAECGLQIIQSRYFTIDNAATCEGTWHYTTKWTIGDFCFEKGETSTGTNHKGIYDLKLLGKTCEDGVEVTYRCQNCGSVFEETRTIYDHNYYVTEEVDLTEFGACEGTVYYYRCGCGQGQSVGFQDYDSGSWVELPAQTDAEGHRVFVEAYICGDGCLKFEQTYYSDEKDPATCNVTTYYTVNVTVNGKTVYAKEYTYTNSNHTYYSKDIIAKLLEGSETCEDGVLVTRTCRDCGTTETYINHYHNTHYTEIDLSAKGACEDSKLIVYACACGERVDSTYIWSTCAARGHNSSYTDEAGKQVSVRTCDVCGLKIEETDFTSEKDNECRYTDTKTFKVTLGEEVLYNEEYTNTYTSHNVERTYELLGGVNSSCEDGVKVSEVCKDCGHTGTYTDYYHNTHYTVLADLTEYGACSGKLSIYQCACGQETKDPDLEDTCADQWTDTERVEDGKHYHVTTRSCSTCGLIYTSSYYEERDPSTCTSKRYYTVVVNVGNNLVKDLAFVRTYSSVHDYEYTYQLLGATCEDGVLLTSTCKDCGEQYSETYNWHRTFPVQTIDLYDYGCVCGGTATVSRCACGKYESLDYDCLCEFDDSWCEPWVENQGIPQTQDDSYLLRDEDGRWISEYNNYYLRRSSGSDICAVNDPADRACGFGIRYCTYYVRDDKTCQADAYQVWQCYDKANDKWVDLLEEPLHTGTTYACHAYEVTLDETYENGDRHILYTCACSSTAEYKLETKTEDATITVTETNEAINRSKNGRNKSYLAIYENYYNVENPEYNTGSRDFYRHEYADGTFSCDESQYRRFDMTTLSGGSFSTVETIYRYSGSNGKLTEDGSISYSYWRQYDYEYRFGAPGCYRIRTYINSDGAKDVSTENCCPYRSWEEISYVERTCTQDGESVRVGTCPICGKQKQQVDHYTADGHAWVQEGDFYYCARCGMENTNGANGHVALEDLTDYENGDNYLVGYYNPDAIVYTPYVCLLLKDGTQVNLDGIAVTQLETPRAYSFSKREVKEAAEALGYTDEAEYDVKFVYVPVTDGGNFDYAVVFRKTDREIGIISESVAFVDYLSPREPITYIICPKTDGTWVFTSNCEYQDPYAQLFDANWNYLTDDDDSGSNNNYWFSYDLEAEKTYHLRVNWSGADQYGFLMLKFQENAD